MEHQLKQKLSEEFYNFLSEILNTIYSHTNNKDKQKAIEIVMKELGETKDS